MENQNNEQHFLFGRKNYVLLVIGLVLIVLGFYLMSGGASADDNFQKELTYSETRITVAPILVLLGFLVEFFAIMLRPDK